MGAFQRLFGFKARHKGIERRPELVAEGIAFHHQFVLGARDFHIGSRLRPRHEVLDHGCGDDPVVARSQHQTG